MGNISIMSTPKTFGMSAIVRFLIVQLEMLRSSASVTEAKDVKMGLGRWLSGGKYLPHRHKKTEFRLASIHLKRKEEKEKESVMMCACNSNTEGQTGGSRGSVNKFSERPGPKKQGKEQ